MTAEEEVKKKHPNAKLERVAATFGIPHYEIRVGTEMIGYGMNDRKRAWADALRRIKAGEKP